jgi:hypothetical protein
MRKKEQKQHKNHKTKIELQIKSKTVTNNFILTPRTVSPKDQRDALGKNDRFVEDNNMERLRHEEGHAQRYGREGKNSEHRRVITDSTKFNMKKRFEDDETGTHTPVVRRVSVTHEGFYKKKSSNSLLSSDKIKTRKKTS